MSGVDLDAYVAEHDAEWRRLEQLSRGRRLTAAEVDELVALYQRAATHLSVVRSRSPDPTLVARLSRLVLTARATITGGSRFSWRSVGSFFTEGFPLAVYRAWPWWSGVALACTALIGFLMWWVAGHPESVAALIGEEAAEELVASSFVGHYTQSLPPIFTFHLWTHNAWLAVRCLASGVLIVPVLWMLWNNALNVGVVGGVMISYGRGDLFFSMITPHGLLELTGLYVAAGVGLRIGWSWIAPGPNRTRGRAVIDAARDGMLVAVGLVGLFAVAAVIEAFVTPSPLPAFFRIGIGAAVWLAFLGYVLILGSAAAAKARARVQQPH